MSRLVIVALCLLVTVSCWTNEQLLQSVAKACPAQNYMCPKSEYGLFDGFDWEWDAEAIISSPTAEEFRKSRSLNKDTLAALKSTFCCIEGPCLYRCGIFPRTEIDLISAFPANAQDILKLDLPELKKHREFVSKWLKNQGQEDFRRTPAELEDFFDSVYAHQDKIRQRLQSQQETR